MKAVPGSLIDPLNDYPGYALRRVSSEAMARFASRVKVLGLRPAEATVLLVIGANTNATQSSIGQLLDIARANMAPLVSRLARMGYIGRQPVDGRSHGLKLTEDGRKMLRKLEKVVAAHEKDLWSRVPAVYRSHFMAALQSLRKA
jgi:DNA-binding MarR family transcriptional regulator